MECKYSVTCWFNFETWELIDTLWNVNTDDTAANEANKTGINRYIMECKYTLYVYWKEREKGINRYIMECK